MRFFSMSMMLLTLLLVEAFRAPLKKGGVKKNKLLKKGGANVLKVLGETGLGVISLSAALAILNSLEADTDPSDQEILSLIGAERERLLSLSRSSWVTPVAWGSSAGISILVFFVFIFRIIRRKRSKQGERKETRRVTVSIVKEQNTSPPGLQFGEVNLQTLDI